MQQKTKNHQNQGSIDKKFDFFFPVPKSHTQMGSLSAKNASEKFSRLGTFKRRWTRSQNLQKGKRAKGLDKLITMK